MASWPDLDELKRRLDVTSDDYDGEALSGDENVTDLSRILAAAIEATKQRIGEWDDDTDEPDEAIAESALQLAIEWAREPGAPTPSRSSQLLYGHRKRWGTA